MRTLTFTVAGRARPQGSKRPLGRGVMVEQSKHLGPWRRAVASAAVAAARAAAWPTATGPVVVHIVATYGRPASHYRGKAKVLREGSPRWVDSNVGDVDKVARGILDALTTAGVFDDDRRVARLIVSQLWGDEDETTVSVGPVQP